MALHALRAGLLAAGLFWAAVPAPAAPQALLVGVSGYPSLPEARRLRGPRNDVPLMRDALQRAGMPPEGIVLLADGVPGSAGLPTRGAILAALAALAARAEPGDWVVVYFSGHGSQQPQPPVPPGSSRYREPDGLDEIFLPYDIGRWDGRIGSVQGALVDDEIGVALAAIGVRGARVWAIFDTCHAGDMARAWHGAQPGRTYRAVPPEALGVPLRHPARVTGAGHLAPVAQPSGRRATAATPASAGPVLFYASHPDEPAAEEPLPEPNAGPTAGGPGAARAAGASAAGSAAPLKVYGYFTWLIAQELGPLASPAGRPSTTLAALADRVAQRYASRPYPTPLFEGDLTQVPDFFSRRALTSAPQQVPGHQAPPRTSTIHAP